jgi:toxin FitB
VTYLLDTNVLSECWKPKPSPVAMAWLEGAQWYLPAPVIAEIQEGAESDPSQARRAQINARLNQLFNEQPECVLPWDSETARIWGRLRHSRDVRLKPQALWDSLIDAMGVRYDMAIATRNGSDFRHAKTFNPWKD